MSRRRHPVAGRRFWVVGASSGIGAALAGELERRGAKVAISARREADLQEVASDDMVVVPVDATDRAAMSEGIERVRRELGGLDTVVWCAGYWEQVDATSWDADVFARHIEVNLLGLNNLLAAALPQMTRTGTGHIVGVASVAGYRGLAGAEAYGATKAAQINLFEALRAGLNTTGVRVTTVCPGFVRTPMTDSNEFPMPFLIEPDEAGRAIVDGLERGRSEIVFPLPMAILMKTVRLLPARIWNPISARMAAARQ